MSNTVFQPQAAQSWLDEQLPQRPLTVLVFFRGVWCPFCQAYLREMNGAFVSSIREVGGELIAVTSQGIGGARQAHTDWKLSYPLVSNPDNSLARRFGVSITPKSETAFADDPEEYSQGLAQPAVIALGPQGEILFKWISTPSQENLGGASDRPLPHDVWRAIDASRRGGDVDLSGGTRLDPDFLAAHYPEAHAVFTAWMAQSQAAKAD